VLAAAAAYLLDYLDDTIKLPEDLGRITDYPVIGYLSDWGDEMGNRVFVAENPRHPVVEGYRTLRTNLEFASVDEEVKTIFVASADTEDGNRPLRQPAVVLSQAEKSSWWTPTCVNQTSIPSSVCQMIMASVISFETADGS
jgi:hypothetical protein